MAAPSEGAGASRDRSIPAAAAEAGPSSPPHNQGGSTDLPPIDYDALYQRELGESRRSREIAKSSIQGKDRRRILQTLHQLSAHLSFFEKSAEQFARVCCRLNELKDKYLKSKDFNIKKLIKKEEAELDKIRLGMNEQKKILLSFRRTLGFRTEDSALIDDYYDAPSWLNEGLSLPRAFEYKKEQILNACVYRQVFLQQVKRDLESKKPEILKRFFSDVIGGICDARFKLIPEGSETHNKGQVAVKVHVYWPEGKRSFYYKPRSAQLENAIMDTFERLNQVGRGDKGINSLLRTVKIECFETFSIWEYIDGKHPSDHYTTVQNYVEEVAGERSRLMEQLKTLERVCYALKIGDLHRDNVLIDTADADNPKIIPIDCESRYHDNRTCLVHDREKLSLLPLGKTESVLVKQFEEEVKSFSVRLIPVSTAVFSSMLGGYQGFEFVGVEIRNALQKRGYQMACSLEELSRLALTDFFRNDIPYLTQVLKKEEVVNAILKCPNNF